MTNQNVKIDQIKKLREQTSAPIMDCKRALQECDGDENKAKEWLKKKGLAQAAKKKAKKAVDGLIYSYVHSGAKVGAILQLNCQTDFVARNQDFQKLAQEICLQIVSMNPKNVSVLLKQEYIRDSQKKISDLIDEAIAKFGENIKVGEFARLAI